MPGFIDRAQFIRQIRSLNAPQGEVLSVLRAHGLLKRRAHPKNLTELSPRDIRFYATFDRTQRALLDMANDPPTTPPSHPGTLGRLFDSTFWTIRDWYAHKKFSHLRSLAVAGVALRESIPDLAALSGEAAQAYENLRLFSSGISGLQPQILARDLRRQGIFQDAAKIPLEGADPFGLIQANLDIRQLELSLYSLKGYFDKQEKKQWFLMMASAFTALYMTLIFGFRVQTFFNPGGLVTDSAAALLLLWPELYCYFDTAVNRGVAAYGLYRLGGAHGQNHLPRQFSKLEFIPPEEAVGTHVVHTFGEAPTVCWRHLVYSARNVDEKTKVVLWGASLHAYFIFGERGTVNFTKARMALRGLFEGALKTTFPELDSNRRSQLAGVLTDIDPELSDPEMNHIYFRDMIDDIGRDELGVGNKKIKLLAEALSPILLKASLANPTSGDLERAISEAWLREQALGFGISYEKSILLAKRTYERWLSAGRRAKITTLAQPLVEDGKTESLPALAELVSSEFGLAEDQVTQFLNTFVENRREIITTAYASILRAGEIIRTEKGREFLAEIFRYVEKIKYEQEQTTSIEVRLPEILRQLIDKTLFIEQKHSLRRIIKKLFRRRRMVKQMAIEMARRIERLNQDDLYALVNQGLAGREDVGLGEYLDVERTVYKERAELIAQIAEEISSRHGLSSQDRQAVRDAVVNDYFWQNLWIETRLVAWAILNEMAGEMDDLPHLEYLLRRDIPDNGNKDPKKNRNPGFNDDFLGPNGLLARIKEIISDAKR